MIIIDTALKERRRPIRVGMIGAGFMGRGIARQILTATPGMDLVVISNRHLQAARRACVEAGIATTRGVDSPQGLTAAIVDGVCAITDNPSVLCQAREIDAIIEVTGAVEFGANVAMAAIRGGKHFIAMNAELDATVGPILKTYADEAGVVFTNADGDQPGVTMNLYRFVKGIGVKPVLCGNIRGFHDFYRTPATQKAFAEKWGQKAHMVTSFADGSKVAFEQAIIANATGMHVGKRGMYSPRVEVGTPISEAAVRCFEKLLPGDGSGIVDYIIGAHPAPGVFVLGTCDDPVQQHYLRLYKLGPGPLYCFYTPYHLCHFEVPNTVARAVLFGDAAIAPLGGPCVDVVTTAKRDLKIGETLDGIGWYMTYGLCEISDAVRQEQLLPMGLAEGCNLVRDVPKDQVLTYDDVNVPQGRLCDRLRAEQMEKADWTRSGLGRRRQ